MGHRIEAKFEALSEDAQEAIVKVFNTLKRESIDPDLLEELLVLGKELKRKKISVATARQGAIKQHRKDHRGEKEPRQPSGYLVFGLTERKKITDEDPDKAPKDIMRAIGTRWRALDDGDREMWNRKAARGL